MRCPDCGGEQRALRNVEGYEGMVWVDCDTCGGCGEVPDSCPKCGHTPVGEVAVGDESTGYCEACKHTWDGCDA